MEAGWAAGQGRAGQDRAGQGRVAGWQGGRGGLRREQGFHRQ